LNTSAENRPIRQREAAAASQDAKVVAVETRVVRKAFDKAQWNPRTRWAEKNVVLVLLQTDAGITGIGEAYCDAGVPASVATLIEKDFAPLVIGRSITDLGAIVASIRDTMIVSAKGGAAWAALSAIDIALWDALGKALGQPVCNLLGCERRRVYAYASAGLYGAGKTEAKLAEEMQGYVERGFRAVKIKVGGASLAEDVRRVAAVREAIGPDVRFMVDALYALSASDAIRMSRAIEKYDIHFLEAPVVPEDITGLARVAARGPVAVAGNEFAYGLDGFRRIIESDGVAFVHLDAILCGGISEGRRIAALAASRHLPCSFHAASSAVCFAANLQIAASVPNVDSIEFHMLHTMLFDQLPKDHFRLEDGCVVVPAAPGLGLNVETLRLGEEIR
jgi:L-alanine-DL-glutamate epimerase-like enolase superfamily enzyme